MIGSGVFMLPPYVVSSAAWLRSSNDKGRVVAVLALTYSLYALFGIGAEPLVWGGVLIAAGLPWYFWQRRAIRLE